MNKKVIWGIIALAAVITIAGIAFVVDREEEASVNQQEADQAEKDIVWEVEDKLLSAREKINEIQKSISDKKYDSLMDEYNKIEDAMYEMQDAYMDDKLNDKEFEEGLKNISKELDTFINDLEIDEQ